MNPGIKSYLEEHGATYTPEALRKGLVDAGYDPAEVDAALGGWSAFATVNKAGAEERRRFGRLALGLHALALVAVFVVLVALKGTDAVGSALLGVGVLAVALLVGWIISSLIGRVLLRGSGMTIALIAPAISALALGGTCFALMDSLIGTPPRDGTVALEVEAPRAFRGSGPAFCYVGGPNSVSVSSQLLGTLDGKEVSASLDWYAKGAGPAPGAASASNAQVYVQFATPDGASFESFGTIFSTTLDVEAAPDGLTGSIRFEGLASEPTGEPGVPTSPEVISGLLTWDCE